MSPVEELRARVKDSNRPCALTGAGVSAESGIATFRGAGGLWRNFKPEDLATPEAFARDPKLVWEWYDWRRGLIAKAQANPGHWFLAKLEIEKPEFWLITQNVDGLHQKAVSRRVLELHGNIWRLRCTSCPKFFQDERVPLPLPPRCPSCGGLLRPGVVWFGESLPEGTLTRSRELAQKADLFIKGKSGEVLAGLL
ncbi:MAG: NAD-dependent deacylase [Elusimicrobia bacterium]|nr:NAD-dependent deacylase [Elusimicrobiota bacterium]